MHALCTCITKHDVLEKSERCTHEALIGHILPSSVGISDEKVDLHRLSFIGTCAVASALLPYRNYNCRHYNNKNNRSTDFRGHPRRSLDGMQDMTARSSTCSTLNAGNGRTVLKITESTIELLAFEPVNVTCETATYHVLETVERLHKAVTKSIDGYYQSRRVTMFLNLTIVHLP